MLLDEAKLHDSFPVIKNGRMGGLLDKDGRVKLVLGVLGVTPLSRAIAQDILDRNATVEFILEVRTRAKWNNENTAASICALDLMRRETKRIQATASGRFPKEVRTFDQYMQIAAKCALTKKDSDTSKTTGEQRGIPIQHSIKFDMNKLAAHACPACGHANVMAIGLSNAEINEYNEEKKAEHNQDVATWHATTKKLRKGTKPSAPVYKVQEFACYCCLMYCNSRNDGGNCRQCVDGYKQSGSKKKNPFLQPDMTCACPVCNCNCSAKYKATDRDSIALNHEIQKKQKEGQKKDDGREFTVGMCCCCVCVYLSCILSHQESHFL